MSSKTLILALTLALSLGAVINVGNLTHYENLVDQAGNKIVLVQFWSEKCDECKEDSEWVNEVEADHKKDLIALRVDVQKAPQVALYEDVDELGLPLFKFYHKGVEIQDYVGSVEGRVDDFVDDYIERAVAEQKRIDAIKESKKKKHKKNNGRL